MFVTRPPVRKLVPSWDLFSVLSALTKPPFEPLSGATLLHLAVKVAFLVAKRKEDDSVAGMSRGGMGRTVEGAIVCESFSIFASRHRENAN